MGNKNKSVSSNEKSQKPKDGKAKKDKKGPSEKKEIAVFIIFSSVMFSMFLFEINSVSKSWEGVVLPIVKEPSYSLSNS